MVDEAGAFTGRSKGDRISRKALVNEGIRSVRASV